MNLNSSKDSPDCRAEHLGIADLEMVLTPRCLTAQFLISKVRQKGPILVEGPLGRKP